MLIYILWYVVLAAFYILYGIQLMKYDDEYCKVQYKYSACKNYEYTELLNY